MGPFVEPITDAHARLEQVADHVFVIVHDDATDEWPHGNTGVVVGRTGVFVVDSTYLPSRAQADISLIRQITELPVRYLATTHWHFDHNNGAVAYREAFPDVALVAERNTARWTELNQVYWSRMSTAPDSARRASLATLEAELRFGAGEDGVPFSAEERAHREDIVARRTNELAELESLVTVMPDTLFDDTLRIRLDGIPIELHNWGRANSPADITIWLPRQQVLFTGDILVQGPLPYVGASWPVPWIEVLSGIEAVPATVIVPGHGPVMHDATYVRQVHDFFAAVVARVEAGARAGKTLDQLQADLDLEDLRGAVPIWNGDDVLGDDWDYTRTTLIERAWRSVRGQG